MPPQQSADCVWLQTIHHPPPIKLLGQPLRERFEQLVAFQADNQQIAKPLVTDSAIVDVMNVEPTLRRR